MSRSRVFVAGSWDEEKAASLAGPARRVGELIAQAGHDLGCGPGTGVSAHVIAGFRSVPARAGRVCFVLPAPQHMKAVGEVVRYDLADHVEQTDLDYPTRNVLQLRRSHGLVVIGGGGGTLQEINLALHDYRLPVGVLAASGPAPSALPGLLRWFPDWEPLVRLSTSPEVITRWVLDRLAGHDKAAPPPSA